MKTNILIVLGIFTVGSLPSLAFGSCEPNEFVAVEGPQATISISGRGYSPRCLKVQKGTAVTIQASDKHPLQGVQMNGEPKNPFVRGTDANRPETHTLMEAGKYGFFCTDHGDSHGSGMAGEILVE